MEVEDSPRLKLVENRGSLARTAQIELASASDATKPRRTSAKL
jgi:hypothetical protein